jgi:hypothetical protein
MYIFTYICTYVCTQLVNYKYVILVAAENYKQSFIMNHVELLRPEKLYTIENP